MKRHEQLGFNFFRYCNENLSNTNEYTILLELSLNILAILKPFPLEQIASRSKYFYCSVMLCSKDRIQFFPGISKDGLDYFIRNLNMVRTVS